jgi:hypothetical protein
MRKSPGQSWEVDRDGDGMVGTMFRVFAIIALVLLILLVAIPLGIGAVMNPCPECPVPMVTTCSAGTCALTLFVVALVAPIAWSIAGSSVAERRLLLVRAIERPPRVS